MSSREAFTINLEGDYLNLDNGVFSATDNAPTDVTSFHTLMSVSVADSLGKAKDRTFRLNYHYSAGELVSVTYTRMEGVRKADAAPVSMETNCHPNATYSFSLQANAPLGMRLVSYRVNAYNGDTLVRTSTVSVTSSTPRNQTLTASTTGNVTRYTIECIYEDAVIYPVYFLGFMGRLIYYKEVNDMDTQIIISSMNAFLHDCLSLLTSMLSISFHADGLLEISDVTT